MLTAERMDRYREVLEMRKIPLCWAIVRVHEVWARNGTRVHKKKEEIVVFHNSGEAKAEYARMLKAPNNDFTPSNLKLVARRLYFGEGKYQA